MPWEVGSAAMPPTPPDGTTRNGRALVPPVPHPPFLPRSRGMVRGPLASLAPQAERHDGWEFDPTLGHAGGPRCGRRLRVVALGVGVTVRCADHEARRLRPESMPTRGRAREGCALLGWSRARPLLDGPGGARGTEEQVGCPVQARSAQRTSCSRRSASAQGKGVPRTRVQTAPSVAEVRAPECVPHASRLSRNLV